MNALKLALALVAAAIATSQAFAAQPEGKPNIIFMMADDLGYGDVACLNPESKIPTPNLDRLAGQGMTFTDAHTPSAVCTPTRYALLTGRYCWRSRLKSGVLQGFSEPLIEPGRLTAGSLMKRNGYATAVVGKWHLGLDWAKKSDPGPKPEQNNSGWDIDFSAPFENGPLTKGFDYFFGISASLDMPPYIFLENDRTVDLPTEYKPRVLNELRLGGREGPMVPGWRHENVLPTLTEKAVAFIERQTRDHPEQPFFLYFPLNAPHTPVAPTEEFAGKSQAGDYGDFVVEVDWSLGQISETLERLGLADNTLLIFTSDNGPEKIMVARIKKYGHDSSHIYRGMKRDAWEGGHRVPFFARWPGEIEPGSRSDETICLVDLMATCAAITGDTLSSEAGEDSYNILPALRGESGAEPIREATVHHTMSGEFAIRQGKWKLILCQGSGGNKYDSGPDAIQPDDPPGQLYDIIKDPSETKNLYTARTEVVERLSALMDRYKEEGRSVAAR